MYQNTLKTSYKKQESESLLNYFLFKERSENQRREKFT